MKPLRQVRFQRETSRGVVLDGQGVEIEIMVLGPRLGRVLAIRDGGLRQRRTWTVTGGANDVPWEGRDRRDVGLYPAVAVTVERDAHHVRVIAPDFTIEIRLAPFRLRWLLPDGHCFAADRTSHPYAFASDGHGFAHCLARRTDDRYYGLGDKTGPLDLHGRRLRTKMLDALGYDARTGDPLYKHWPFTITRDGATGVAYGVYYDTMGAAELDLGCEHDNYHGFYRSFEADDGDLDYYVMLGPGIADVTASFLRLTGKTAFGPRWALGYHCTAMPLADAPDAQAQIAGFLARCGEHEIPCSAFHFGSGYTSIGKKRYVYNWNHAKFPDPKALMAQFHAKGLRLVANLKPCLLDDHPRYAEVEAQGAFVREGDTGKPSIDQFWDGEGAYLDFTNPRAISWWQEGLQSAILDMGIDCAWNDNNEYGVWSEDAVCDGFGEAIPIALARPLHALLMTRASAERQAAAKPGERVYTVTRAGCPGIQRYAQTWTGDNTTSWHTLRWNLRMGLTMSLSGMVNTGHDVGGFAGPPPEPELFIRWVQSGLLHPRFIMNSWKADGTVTTPWMHPDLIPAARWAIRLRYRLVPYLYSLAWRAASDDALILRPTFVDFPDDADAVADCDELMVGSSLLAAPVVEPGARSRSLRLPAGPACWYDFYDETKLPAGETVSVDAPLDRVPLFVPAGAILPMTAEAADFSRLHDEPSRCLRLFPAPGTATSSFTLYEDDGLGFGYRSGDFAAIACTMTSSEAAVTLRLRRTGGYALQATSITVSLPRGERRPLVIDAGADLPPVVPGAFVLHAL